VAAYLAVAMLCSSKDAPLLSTPNRAGFVALSQLPPVFLFATKNSPLSILLGPGVGYEQLNFLHRWSARGLIIGALVHGSLWIRNHLIYNIEIIGAQKETSGVAALGVLCGIFLTSLRVVRRASWRFFFIAQ
jgi:ferric-chelate reductase